MLLVEKSASSLVIKREGYVGSIFHYSIEELGKLFPESLNIAVQKTLSLEYQSCVSYRLVHPATFIHPHYSPLQIYSSMKNRIWETVDVYFRLAH